MGVPQSGTVSKSGWTTDGRTDVSETFCIIRMPTKDQGFTEDQVEDFKEVFQLFDTKGDGLIQVNQVGEVLRALGTNPTEGEVKKLVQSTVSFVLLISLMYLNVTNVFLR